LCLVNVAALVGCGKGDAGLVKVHGRVVQNGKPLPPPTFEEQYYMVELSPLENKPGGIVGQSELKPETGEFAVRHPSGAKGWVEGLPPGKYRLSLRTGLNSDSPKPDRFAGKFDSPKNQILVDVSDERLQKFVIDIGTRTVTKE
jgi:hypothetical protein